MKGFHRIIFLILGVAASSAIASAENKNSNHKKNLTKDLSTMSEQVLIGVYSSCISSSHIALEARNEKSTSAKELTENCNDIRDRLVELTSQDFVNHIDSLYTKKSNTLLEKLSTKNKKSES